tara:strand:+ start:887 stop:1432 length:546 start_codon:yes stop_codon:yes gene_type:complete
MSYYKDLNVLPTATMQEIENAYIKLNSNNITFNYDQNQISRAYITLSDYNSRRKYDNLMEEMNKVAPLNEDNNYQNINQDNYHEDVLFTTTDDDINHNLNKLFGELNIRLENIEKKLYTNRNMNNHFHKEKQKIREKFINGKKNIIQITEININGVKKHKTKTISYDKNGNQEINYKIKDI